MNELTTFQSGQLPDTIEDLTQFVLVGKATLDAYMLKLRAVNRLSTAQDIRNQTLKEAQEVNTALIAAEQRIGEILLAIPKASGQYAESENRPESKNTLAKRMGYTKDEISDYQRMAQNPEIVERVIEQALADGKIATTSQVVKAISEEKKLRKELEDENKKLRTVISEQGAKNAELKSQLENQEPRVEIREVKVVPEDYEELKEKAKRADIHKAGFKEMRDAYEEMAEKWKRSEAEKDQMRKQMNEPETERAEKLKLSTVAFCGGVANFIERFGGYVWLTQELENMEKRDRDDYIRAIKAIEAWVYRMKENMGVHNDNG